MSLVFTGDVAIPFDCEINLSELLPIFDGKRAIVNLEGMILENKDELKGFLNPMKYSIYSSEKVIDALVGLNAAAASLLNNHSLDYKYPLSRTFEKLKARGIAPFGRRNPDFIRVNDNGQQYLIVTFATGCTAQMFELFKPSVVVKMIGELRAKYPQDVLIVYPHWGIELSPLPDPADRHLAHRLIDAGADMIIGHHPHVVQPIEIYNGKKIYYSLGNFIFPQTRFGEKILRFSTDRVLQEMVVEIDGLHSVPQLLRFDNDHQTLVAADDVALETINGELSDAKFKKLFLKAVGRSKYLRFARYADSDFAEKAFTVRSKAYQAVRKLCIKLHLHNPYH